MMNKKDQNKYLEEYKKDKEKGVPFFPDIIYKDAVVGLIVFLILVGLAVFVGAPLEERANPADSSYNPRPEWYFLFLFQALKYFPGNLEVLGAIIIPIIAILVLFGAPFLDRGSKRHPLSRPAATGIASVVILLLVGLTLLAFIDLPPQTGPSGGYLTSELYRSNCGDCHGQIVKVPPSADLKGIIAAGGHEGMPPWQSDLSPDQIEVIAAFASTSRGDDVYTQECYECHTVGGLETSEPLEFKAILDKGPEHPAHLDTARPIPDWSNTLQSTDFNNLLSFIAAPVEQQQYVYYCAGCHGDRIDLSEFKKPAEQLTETLATNKYHQDLLLFTPVTNDNELQILAEFVLDPENKTAGKPLFESNCAACHYEVIPAVDYIKTAKTIITTGGDMHSIVPNWSDGFTQEEATNLVSFVVQLGKGENVLAGSRLFQEQCAVCHGPLGEGGINPGLPGDMIPPISSSEYLRTRGDYTLDQIIAMGQPNFGMSPFSLANGGPLGDDEIKSIISFMRTWEENPPVDAPIKVDVGAIALNGAQIYETICAECHGIDGKGDIGPSINSAEYRETHDEEYLRSIINSGVDGSVMLGWGIVFPDNQIDDLIIYMGIWSGPQQGEPVSYSQHIQPIFNRSCLECHNSQLAANAWRVDSYQQLMKESSNITSDGLRIVPGDSDSSILGMVLTGERVISASLQPRDLLYDFQINWIKDWINAGALDN